MRILKDISKLVEAGVITRETVAQIENYYKKDTTRYRGGNLGVIFAILGATLVGLGIILMIAHNWDNFSQDTKTAFAFFPLISGQIICGYTLLCKRENIAWRESSAIFLSFAVGSSISLVSQIYHIIGEIDVFILTWLLLCLPLVYLMKSSIVSLLYIIGVTYYAVETNYLSNSPIESYTHWSLFLGILPYYFQLCRVEWKDNYFVLFHHWFIPLSVIVMLGTVAQEKYELMFIGYFSVFGLFCLIGNSKFFDRQELINNGYKILATLGTMFLLLVLSFDWFWKDLNNQSFYYLNGIIRTPEFLVSAMISILTGGFLYFQYKYKGMSNIEPLSIVFILFIGAFFLGLYWAVVGLC